MTRRIQESSFTILANGASGSPPASGLIEYLLMQGTRRVTTVFHPLTLEEGGRHEITIYEPSREPRRRTLILPTRPPYTYPVDTVVPLRLPRSDACFAFNNLLCARALLERCLHRADTVVYWAVDFVPNRFGPSTALTRAYDRLDAYCCKHADLRIEVSTAALEGRDSRHGLSRSDGAPRTVGPIGAWLDRVPTTPHDGWRSRRVVFIGHLVERMGGDTVIGALALLRKRGVDVTVDIAGRGPLEQELRAQASQHEVQDAVRFHGFISDHQQLEQLLAGASVALAPYSTRVESFTRFADPSKLKSYLAAGLPILLTDVPPNAHELQREAGAQVVPDAIVAFADAIQRTLDDVESWERRRTSALQYAQRFDWNTIIADVLAAAGFQG